ncbi:sporulation protein [Dactylosporangium maewongense]|uniref:Sporulation protein n=1 Tax=Dactylosporangium maewongense TaxID=634393 RepID=A0ABN2A9G3_9ACTN
MVFKSLKRALGVGGPTVDTVLDGPDVQPGGYVQGQVRFAGGDHEVEVERIVVALQTRVEVEGADSEYDATVEFQRQQLTGGFRLGPGQQHAVPFQLPIPWETPITHMYGQRLHGMTMGVRTELEVARAIDKGDLDAINVHPLPVQGAILDAFGQLGFRFKAADLERGHIHGVHQTLPFYQEIEFYAAHQYASRINEVEVTFVTDPHGTQVIIEFDKRGGIFTEGTDSISRFQVGHAQAGAVNWPAEVNNWIQQATQRRGWHF